MRISAGRRSAPVRHHGLADEAVQAVLGTAVCFLLLVPGPATAQVRDFGDVRVAKLTDLPSDTTHGYREAAFRIENRSASRVHRVTISGPAELHGFSGTDFGLRRISRTFVVAPGSAVRAAIPIPPLDPAGTGWRLEVDGRADPDPLPGGPNGPAYWTLQMAGSGSGRADRVLTGPRIRETDLEGPPPAGPAPVHSGVPEIEIHRHSAPLEGWSPDWLAYSGWDGVVLDRDELRAAPAGVRAALASYAAAGGSLAILGAEDPRELVPGIAPEARLGRARVAYPGLGIVLALPVSAEDLAPADLDLLRETWAGSVGPWAAFAPAGALAGIFGVVENLSVPVRGLFLLVVGFTVLIGPVNVFVLSRRGRRIWLLWTVPVLSFVTCGLVLGWALLGEGLLRLERREILTVLDQEAHRASSFGLVGMYATLTPGDGLRFPATAEVTRLGDRSGWGGGPGHTVDWTEDQHLASGWIGARLASHFAVRQVETRRERLGIEVRGDAVRVVNGLGARIETLWLADAAGRLHRAAGPLVEGAAADLDPTELRSTAAPTALRELYRSDLPTRLDRALAAPAELLVPGSYAAVVHGSPFVGGLLPGAGADRLRTVVIGRFSAGGST